REDLSQGDLMRILTALVTLVLLVASGLAGQGQRQAAPPRPPCDPAGAQYVCGQTSPEDLVVIPGGEYVVASAFGGMGGIKIIKASDRTTSVAYPSATAKERFDKKTYDTCPGPPDAADKNSFRTHGLALRPGKNSTHTLYAVHHNGARESIEVFEINAK